MSSKNPKSPKRLTCFSFIISTGDYYCSSFLHDRLQAPQINAQIASFDHRFQLKSVPDFGSHGCSQSLGRKMLRSSSALRCNPRSRSLLHANDRQGEKGATTTLVVHPDDRMTRLSVTAMEVSPSVAYELLSSGTPCKHSPHIF